MARRHFDDSGKPLFADIVADVRAQLRAQRAELREIYVVGSYGRQIAAAAATRSGADLDALVDAVQKRWGDVDLLVSYAAAGAAVSRDQLEAALASGVDAGTNGRDYGIETWLSPTTIVPRASGIWMLYPRLAYDVAPEGT